MNSPTLTHQLVFNLARRDIRARYQGSMLGLLWVILNPLILLAMYSFVFTVVFRAKWNAPQVGEAESSLFDFAILLFCGLIIHAFLAEILSAAPKLILSNKNFVKKVVFPLTALPIVTTCTAIFHFAIKLVVLALFILAVYKALPITALYAPLIFLPLIILSLGLGFAFASLGVYLRDINQIIPPLLTGLLFIGPILYPTDAAPEPLRPFLFLNPLSVPVEQIRNVMIFGQQPDWIPLAIYSGVAVCVFLLGLVWFQKTKPGFSDVV